MIGVIGNRGGSIASGFSKENFLQYCRRRHKFIYEYIFKKCTQQTMVFKCPYHGTVSVDSEKHFKGLGCPKCLVEKKKTYDDFLRVAAKRHGKRFKYPKNVKGYSLQSRIKIKCPDHGEFIQAAHAHLNSNHGCPHCAKGQLSKKMFVKAAKKKYKDRFDYTNIPPGILNGKVQIKCNTHGWFMQYPQSHLEAETGCMDCAYDERNPGVKHFYLYLFECRKGKARFYKPGLANNVERRGKEHARALAPGWGIKLIGSWKLSSHHGAYSTEQYILNNLPGRKVSPKVMSVGHTEAKYNNLSRAKMKEKMEKLIKSYLRKSKTYVHKSQKFK